jgi:hypothetical protein
LRSIGGPAFEFLALLDRAAIWAVCGQLRDALAAVEAARAVLTGTASRLLTRADELEAVLRLSLGDVGSATALADRLPPARSGLLLARIAVSSGDHHAAQTHLHSASMQTLTPRQNLVRQILLGAAAVERHDPMAAGLVGGIIDTARHGGFLNTVISTAPQLAGHLVEHAAHARLTPTWNGWSAPPSRRDPPRTRPDSRTDRCRTLDWRRDADPPLLPTSSYVQIAATLYISRNTVKTTFAPYIRS